MTVHVSCSKLARALKFHLFNITRHFNRSNSLEKLWEINWHSIRLYSSTLRMNRQITSSRQDRASPSYRSTITWDVKTREKANVNQHGGNYKVPANSRPLSLTFLTRYTPIRARSFSEGILYGSLSLPVGCRRPGLAAGKWCGSCPFPLPRFHPHPHPLREIAREKEREHSKE